MSTVKRAIREEEEKEEDKKNPTVSPAYERTPGRNRPKRKYFLGSVYNKHFQKYFLITRRSE